MNNNAIKLIELTYMSCNKDTIFLFVIIMSIFIISILFVKITVYSHVFKQYNICHPVFYFWGDKRECKKEINQFVKNRFLKKETFINIKDYKNDENIEIFYDIRNLYNDCKKILIINSLAIIEFIQSIQLFINQIITLYFYN